MTLGDSTAVTPPPRSPLPSNVGRLRLIAVIEIVFLGLTAAIAGGDGLLLSWAGVEVSSMVPKHAGSVFGTFAPIVEGLVLYAVAALTMIGVLVVGLIRLLGGIGGRKLIAGPQIVLLGVWVFVVASGIPADPLGWFLSALLAGFPLLAIVLLRTASVRTHGSARTRKA
jgi:hypothetical protein